MDNVIRRMKKMNFEKKVVVTGGVNGIWKCVADKFKSKGAYVAIIDIKEKDYFQGNLYNKNQIVAFCSKIINHYIKALRNVHMGNLIGFKSWRECTIFDS